MKRFTITTLLILFCTMCYGQNKNEEAKKELGGLYKEFTLKYNEFKKEKEKLDDKISRYDTLVSQNIKKLEEIKKELDILYLEQLVLKDSYAKKGLTQESLNNYFSVPDDFVPATGIAKTVKKSEVASKTLEKPGDSLKEKEIYILYGNGRIANEKTFAGNEKAKELFKDIFSVNSETCLGNFEIPGHRQKIRVYKKNERNKGEEGKLYTTIDDLFLYFEEIKFAIREGLIYEIRVRLTTKDRDQEYYFENELPISLLRYNIADINERRFLTNVSITSLDVEKEADTVGKERYRIKISDVLSYLANPGNNFVPDDVEFTFPKNDETVKDGEEKKRRVYKVNQDTNLQNVMELRTYTDFLGLFDDAANGIVQVEGKADFFVSPFQLSNGFPNALFKKISPYFHYARLDDDMRSLTLAPTDSTGIYTIERPLEIIEKSYLDMGLLLDFWSFRPRKDYPFNINIYGAMRYQIATIERENKENENFKTLGLGFGLRFEFKRFNNFGFSFSPELTFYNHLNRFDFLERTDNFWVFRNEAEIFYYPGETKSQSIFLRLRTFMDINDGEDSFFQLQFGYRFSIGLGNVKAKG